MFGVAIGDEEKGKGYVLMLIWLNEGVEEDCPR